MPSNHLGAPRGTSSTALIQKLQPHEPMPTPRRVIAEISAAGYWSAWMEDPPEEAFGGDALAAAIGRLLMARRWSPGVLEFERSTHERRVFRIRREFATP